MFRRSRNIPDAELAVGTVRSDRTMQEDGPGRSWAEVDTGDVGCAGLGEKAMASETPAGTKLARRPLGKTGRELSIVGMGGIVVMNSDQEHANRIVPEFVDRGVNYFDVAPTYGNAEERLGPAIEPRRDEVFLACKTGERTATKAEEELHRSLKRLRTDHVDLYQLHGLMGMEDVEKVFAPDGAMKAFESARKAGKVRLLGFSAHSEEAALAAMDRFEFDTILFPLNFVCWQEGRFGPEVLEKAAKKGMGILALKSMAYTTWENDEAQKKFAKCWYRPTYEPEMAEASLRFTLSLPVTAALPPGEEALFRMALAVAERFEAMGQEEQERLLAQTAGVDPIFRRGAT